MMNLLQKSGGSISTRTAADIASNMVASLMSPIMGRIEPVSLGEMGRALTIAAEYGDRIKTKNVKQKTIYKLQSGYPDHGFVIDITEAKKLFEEVLTPTIAQAVLENIPYIRFPISQKPLVENDMAKLGLVLEDRENGQTIGTAQDTAGAGERDAEAGNSNQPNAPLPRNGAPFATARQSRKGIA